MNEAKTELAQGKRNSWQSGKKILIILGSTMCFIDLELKSQKRTPHIPAPQRLVFDRTAVCVCVRETILSFEPHPTNDGLRIAGFGLHALIHILGLEAQSSTLPLLTRGTLEGRASTPGVGDLELDSVKSTYNEHVLCTRQGEGLRESGVNQPGLCPQQFAVEEQDCEMVEIIIIPGVGATIRGNSERMQEAYSPGCVV